MTGLQTETTPIGTPQTEDFLARNGLEIADGFPLPRPVSLSRALETSGLSKDEFLKRQKIWGDATDPLLDLVDDGSEKLYLTDNPMAFRDKNLLHIQRNLKNGRNTGEDMETLSMLRQSYLMVQTVKNWKSLK